MNSKRIKNTEEIEEKDLESLLKIFYPKGVKKMFRYFRHIYRYLSYSFNNLKYWLPIIWKDRNWDHQDLSLILIHKLKSMRDFYQKGENVWSVEAPTVAAQLNEVIELFEKVEADNYEEEIDPHFNDWIYNGTNHFKEIIDENGNIHHIFDSGHTPEEDEKRKEVWRQAEINKQADIEKAYSLIAKNIQSWWD